MTDLATILTAAGVSLPALGTGIAWIWNEMKIARRADEERFAKLESAIEDCRKRELEGQIREQKRELAEQKRAAVHVLAIELLWQEVVRLNGRGENATLRRVKALLDGLKTELPSDNPDLTALALKLDGDV